MGPSSSQETRAIDIMQQLGFTASEGRAYLALLRKHPATGYEVAADSGVPRSAVYNVLRKLESHGLVNTIQVRPSRYVPIEPERLSELLANRFNSRLEDLTGSLKELAGALPPTTTWTVRGYDSMLDQAASLIKGARRMLHISLWAREALRLEEHIRKAVQAGTQVVVFSFTPLPEGLGTSFSYGLSEEELEQHWKHKIILVADHKEALLGGAEDKRENRAVLTTDFSLLEMAVSNLILDITLFGERTGVDTHDVVTSLSLRMAPIDEMLANRK